MQGTSEILVPSSTVTIIFKEKESNLFVSLAVFIELHLTLRQIQYKKLAKVFAHLLLHSCINFFVLKYNINL